MIKTFKYSGSALVLAGLMGFPHIASATDFTIKVGGRVHLDYTIADLDNPDSDIQGVEVRRARLNVTGKYGDAIKYKFELDKNSGDAVTVKDAYLQFIPQNSPFKIKVGQFKTHVSLDEQNSSRFMSALERSAFTDAFDFGRRLGISVNTSGKNYTFDAGIFATDVEDDPDGSYALSARGTYNPIKTEDTLVHLGASWRYRNQDEDGEDLRFRQRPFTHVTSDRIISTDRFADSDNFIGAEAAVLHKTFWAAGEYGYTAANGSGTNPDADFNGFYGEVGMFFGGKRTYKGGKFGRPKVDKPLGEGGMGAFSLVARYDTVDLQDNGILGGELDTIVLGADWWPTKYTRIGINYFDLDAENGAAEGGSGVLMRVGFDF